MAHPALSDCLNCGDSFFYQCLCGKRIRVASWPMSVWFPIKKLVRSLK